MVGNLISYFTEILSYLEIKKLLSSNIKKKAIVINKWQKRVKIAFKNISIQDFYDLGMFHCNSKLMSYMSGLEYFWTCAMANFSNYF